MPAGEGSRRDFQRHDDIDALISHHRDFFLPAPRRNSTIPKFAMVLRVRDKFDNFRPVRSASSVMLAGGRRLISSSTLRFSRDSTVNNACSEENQSLGSSGLRLRLPERIARVRACIASTDAMPIRSTFMARCLALSARNALRAKNPRGASGHPDMHKSAPNQAGACGRRGVVAARARQAADAHCRTRPGACRPGRAG